MAQSRCLASNEIQVDGRLSTDLLDLLDLLPVLKSIMTRIRRVHGTPVGALKGRRVLQIHFMSRVGVVCI